METIKLPGGEWHYDAREPLGQVGGFGEVFRGRGPDGDVAVKRLKLTAAQAAHRELDISKYLRGRKLQHVVPILDSGQDADSERYFIVMPLCDENLQEVIDRQGSNLKLDSALEAGGFRHRKVCRRLNLAAVATVQPYAAVRSSRTVVPGTSDTGDRRLCARLCSLCLDDGKSAILRNYRRVPRSPPKNGSRADHYLSAASGYVRFSYVA